MGWGLLFCIHFLCVLMAIKNWLSTYIDGNMVTNAKWGHLVFWGSEILQYRWETSIMFWPLSINIIFTLHMSISVYCDNHVAIFMARNPGFDASTKHVKFNCHHVHLYYLCDLRIGSCTTLCALSWSFLTYMFQGDYHRLRIFTSPLFTLLCGVNIVRFGNHFS